MRTINKTEYPLIFVKIIPAYSSEELYKINKQYRKKILKIIRKSLRKEKECSDTP